MPSSDPSERRLIARAAAHTSWARTENPTARTAPARLAFLSRFEDEVDPDRTLTPVERARRARHARKAYFADLARRSAKAREELAMARLVPQVEALIDQIDPRRRELDGATTPGRRDEDHGQRTVPRRDADGQAVRRAGGALR